jgi:GR25 family glycosyltransferase involved in LPS biosynthesis
MKTVVISLESRPDRRATFERWNRGQPLPFAFLDAAEGRRIDPARLVAAGLLHEGEENFNAGSLGNALSHATLWRDCARGREPFLIFEDDACLRGDFWKHAKPLMERHLAAADILVFGYNPESVVALAGSDGVVSAIRFDETVKRRPDYFQRYAALHDARPNLMRCTQFWGLLGYAISPEGAATLLRACLPLRSAEPITLFGTERTIRPHGIDCMINLALQKGRLRAAACYPALVLGPNQLATSDIQTAC